MGTRIAGVRSAKKRIPPSVPRPPKCGGRDPSADLKQRHRPPFAESTQGRRDDTRLKGPTNCAVAVLRTALVLTQIVTNSGADESTRGKPRAMQSGGKRPHSKMCWARMRSVKAKD
jgi:hypothetical protein